MFPIVTRRFVVSKPMNYLLEFTCLLASNRRLLVIS